MVSWKKLLLTANAQCGFAPFYFVHESGLPADAAVRAELPAAVRRAARLRHARRRDGEEREAAAHHRLRDGGLRDGAPRAPHRPRPPPRRSAHLRRSLAGPAALRPRPALGPAVDVARLD